MSSMYLSCSTCALRGTGRDEIEETFRHAPAVGFRHWALGGPFTYVPGLIQWLDVAKLKRRMAEVGLESLTEVWTPPIPTESKAAAALGARHVAMAAEVAAELDCDRLVQTGSRRRQDGIKQTVAGLRRLLDLVDNPKMRICLEPHAGSQILYPDDYEAIFDALDTARLGITVDTGHFHSAGVDWEALVRKYPRKVYNIHVKDHVGSQSVVIGRGEIDLAGLIAVLREVGYTGPLTVEMEVVDRENLPQYIGPAFQYLSNLLGSPDDDHG